MKTIVDTHFSNNQLAKRKLTEDSEQDCPDYVTKYRDTGIQNITFQPYRQLFSSLASDARSLRFPDGKCKKWLLEHRIEGSNYCAACLTCNISFSSTNKLQVNSCCTNINNFQNNYNQINIQHHYAKSTIRRFLKN